MTFIREANAMIFRKIRILFLVTAASLAVFALCACLSGRTDPGHHTVSDKIEDITSDSIEIQNKRVTVVYSVLPSDGETDETFFARMLAQISDSLGREVQSSFNYSGDRYSSAISVSQLEMKKLATLSFIAELNEETAIEPPKPVKDTVKTEDM